MPIPVSEQPNSNNALSSSIDFSIHHTRTDPPGFVNLTALSDMAVKSFSRYIGLPIRHRCCISPFPQSTIYSTPFSSAIVCLAVFALRNTSARSNFSSCSTISPDSSLLRSRISFIRETRCLADSIILSRHFFCISISPG